MRNEVIRGGRRLFAVILFLFAQVGSAGDAGPTATASAGLSGRIPCAIVRDGIRSNSATFPQVLGGPFEVGNPATRLRDSGLHPVDAIHLALWQAGLVLLVLFALPVLWIVQYRRQKKELDQYKRALDASSIFTVTDGEGHITYVNDKFCEISDYEREEIIGKTHRILNSGYHPTSFWANMYAVTAQGIPWRAEVCNRSKDGELYWADTTVVPLRENNGRVRGYLTIRTDITDRKRVETALQRAMQEAEKANRSKTEFLANMSHEIRTPMNAIAGMCYLALHTELTAQQRDYLEKIEASSNTLLNLINDILDYSKIEAGMLRMESVAFRLDDVFQNVVDLLRFKAEEKGLELLLACDPSLPGQLVGDPLRLGQVLINLAGNAVKFTHDGEVVLRAETMRRSSRRIRIRFSVKDTGIGMTEEQLDQLFRPFQQADGSTTRKYGGTGLGLSISMRLAELMNGRIWVESAPGIGSTFYFTAEFGVVDQMPVWRAAPPELSGLRVLVVDDHAEARKVLGDMLADFDFDVTVAASPEEAVLAAVSARPPFDLVFMDWLMPELDGIEAARRICGDPRLSKVPKMIMVTAHGREQVMKQAKEAGFVGFLIKPVTPPLLLGSILTALNLKQPAAAEREPAKARLQEPLRGRVLLAEDNPINQQVAVEILRRFGCDVEVAGDGLEVLRCLDAEDFDLVLMDIQMPNLDGLQTTARIRSDHRHARLPVIAMTAHAMVGDRELSLAAGMDGHITKPIDPDRLYDALRQWLPRGGTRPRSKPSPARALPHLPGVDIETGLKRVGGNRVLYLKLLREFYLDHRNDVSAIAEAIAAAEFGLAARILHNVKGVAANLGAMELHSVARALEEDLQAGRRTLTGRHRDRFEHCFGALMGRLAKLREEMPAPGDAAPAPNLVAGLEDLAELLRQGDAESLAHCDRLVPELSAAGFGEAALQLQREVNAFDFDAALGTLATLLSRLQRSRSAS